MSTPQKTDSGIAVVGMAGRFPKARNIDEFWRNLCAGVEGISFFSDEELAAAGTNVPTDNPNFVKARGVLEGADLFDAAFFGVNPREAEVLDPQHRVFLECAWEALEHAGCDPARFDGAIGVFAGMSMNTYLAHNLLAHPELIAQLNEHQLMLANDKDFLPTRVSYKLNLRGPSVNIQTACSTSLVAVCVACQNLLNYECDLALAGAVSIGFPQKRGYLYQEGSIASPDGHCRAFDAKAAGTVAGEGVGIVALKRLDDALADGDTIYAVIKGFAINNDGAQKVGYTAPSVEGQAEVIATAQAMAGVAPETISYIEAHGTGTPLGDPIEVEGLTKAFRDNTTATNFCAIGSVKSNIGHLDVAAGVTGLIKTALALYHKQLPPSLHFESPNPKIDFANSPFRVNAKLAEWKNGKTPRRAGVSSFGIGGTNAHVVLEETPVVSSPAKSRPAQLLLLSAKTEAALDQATANLGAHLRKNPTLDLAEVAYTLQTGRQEFTRRRMVVCHDVKEAAEAFETRDARRVVTRATSHTDPPVVFMFPGQGAQHVNMARELYDYESTFREQVDACCEILKPHLGLDLRTILYPGKDKAEAAGERLKQTSITQPALFVIEYALAKLWMSWGVKPEAMIGHSIGEYVAGCLAGVFSLEDALVLVAARGRMMQQLPAGTMLAVRLPEAEVRPLLGEKLSLAAVNAPSLCVVSGPTEAVEALQRSLTERNVASTPLHTSHAFHSTMMDSILRPFTELVGKVKRSAPQIPFVSNVTGSWITAEQAADPAYWARHLRQTVRFADGVGELIKDPARVLLEVGPGQTLNSLAKQHPARSGNSIIVSSLRHAKDSASDLEILLNAVGQIWLSGVTLDWRSFYQNEQRHRVPLPTYPFERKRYFVEPNGVSEREPMTHSAPVRDDMLQPAKPHSDETPTTLRDRIGADLKSLFAELSGLNPNAMEAATRFTELGFDSLFLTQASLAIEKKFGVRVAFRQLLEELSTLDALAAHIECYSIRGNGTPSAKLEADQSHRTSDAVIPLTEAQRELWFASQMSDAASCAYNECRLLHLRGPLRTDTLITALQQLVNRHEALRTTFAPDGESQQIHPALKLDVPVVDWSKLETTRQVSQLDAAQAEEACLPFDLVNGPLLRARLTRLGEQRHVLVLTVHHIICDGHSLGVLLRDLGELYSTECLGMTSQLAPPLQLSEYVNEQTRRQTSVERAEDEAYWLKQFADDAPVLELPADNPRLLTRTLESGRERHLISARLGQELNHLSAPHNGTLFTTLLAAYGTLLHRLTGQEDIVIGIPLADRAMHGGDGLVGHCVNFLPLRVNLNSDESFAAHLARVRKSFLDAHEHQHYTFGSLLQKLNLPRHADRMPLVSTTFNVQRLGESLKFFGLETELEASAHGRTHFDLGLDVTEINGALQLDCRYSKSLFSAETIQRWLGHFQKLLESAAANPQQSISELSLLSAGERRRVLVEWNETHAGFTHDRCLHQLFEEQVARTPEAVAVVGQNKRFTYGELNKQANKLADQLRKLGVGPDVPVGICMERSAEMVVAVLGVLKAGGAYMPLDPTYPQERLRTMLANARVPLVLTQGLMRDNFKSEISNCQWLCVEDLADADPKQDCHSIPHSALRAPRPSDLAYVIHTSGSTGIPKGVAIEHRNAVNFVHWALGVFTRDELTGVLFSTSLCFDLSVFELFVTLCSGGKVIIAQSALELPSLPVKDEVTLINTVPSAANELVRLNAIPASVRVVNLAGEPLKPALVDKLYATRTVQKVYDLYGPSETTTYSTCALRQPGKPATIGKPIANTGIYLLDKHCRPVPIGVAGEMFIGGAGVARGYLHQSELTAERFVANPFGEKVERLYKTGDLARWLPDGNIEFLGRADHQVKIRGHRIELGEIESTLGKHPAVHECVVLAREGAPDEKQLVAYIVDEPDKASCAPGELRSFLQTRLPDYMIPSAFVVLDALPLTPTGKVNRKALPTPERSRSEAEESFVAPSTPTEVALADIWKDVLHLNNVGAHDNFFELGGHSLLMTQVMSRVRQGFQVELPMRRFFESPTVAGLAVAIEEFLVADLEQMSDAEARRLINNNA